MIDISSYVTIFYYIFFAIAFFLVILTYFLNR